MTIKEIFAGESKNVEFKESLPEKSIWGSGIPRIIGKVKAAGLRKPECVGSEVDLRVNIYGGQINANGAKNGVDGMKDGAEQFGVSKRTISRIFATLQGQDMLEQQEIRRKAKWIIIEKR